MHPPVAYMNRLCTKPFQLPLPNGKTFQVEVGTPVITPTLGIHHDPQYYPDPKRFDPERFSEENKATRPRYTHFGFGEGPRICLGKEQLNATCSYHKTLFSWTDTYSGRLRILRVYALDKMSVSQYYSQRKVSDIFVLQKPGEFL